MTDQNLQPPPPPRAGGERKERQRQKDLPFLFVSAVLESYAHNNAYLIWTPDGMPVPAVSMEAASGMPMGARPLGGHMEGARVLVMYDRSLDPPFIILGPAPAGEGPNSAFLAESMTVRSRAGRYEAAMHASPYNDAGCLLGKYSLGRPVDTLPGDQGWINELGVALMLGKLVATLRASDAAKVEAFWGDDLVRTTAWNHEVHTSHSRLQEFNDGKLTGWVRRATPYLREGLGVARAGTDPTRTPDDPKLKPGAEEYVREPHDDDALIVQRHATFGGHLGDLIREIVCLPPENLERETYKAKSVYRGVLEILKTIEGGYRVRSAKDIWHIKDVMFPVPKELKSPEDPTGDREPPPTGDLSEFDVGADGLKSAGPRVASSADMLAWNLYRQSAPELRNRKKDWYYPEQSDLDPAAGASDSEGNLPEDGPAAAPGHKFTAPLPKSDLVTVDDRSGRKTRMFRCRSFFGQRDDGSILLQDAWGSSVELKDGNIILSPINDIILAAGRSIINWAAFDLILRAGNSLDASAAKGDVRLKAEGNLMALAGNGGTGALLLECRADGDSKAADWDGRGESVTGHGVLIRNKSGPLQVLAQDIVLACNPDGGKMTFDAGSDGDLLLRASRTEMDCAERFEVVLGETPDQVAFLLEPSQATLAIGMRIGGPVTIASESGGADLTVGGGLTVLQGVRCESGVETNGGFTSFVSDQVAKSQSRLDLGPRSESLGQQISQASDEAVARMADLIKTEDEEDDSPGNADYRNKIGFSFRDTVDDLKLDEETFQLFEAGWQKTLRRAGSGTPWDEPEVKAPDGTKTRPHPGQTAWQDWEVLNTYDDVNLEDGTPKASQDMKPDGSGGLKRSSLSEGWLINVQE